MEIRYIPAKKLKIGDSRYNIFQLRGYDEGAIEETPLAVSIRQMGILEPLLVHKIGEEFHIVDGLKRGSIARLLGISELPSLFLPSHIEPLEILRIILAGHPERISSTFINKIRFVSMALNLGIEREIIVKSVLPSLGLKGHKRVLEKMEAITSLPEEILTFCDEKNFSMRQCLHLARYPRELLLQVFSWRDSIRLTASTLEEILSNINDYLRGTGKNLSDFLRDGELKELFYSALTPQERTTHLRSLIKRYRNPLLTGINDRLEVIRKEMPLPGNISLEWDRSLEKREVTLSIRLQKETDLPGLLNILKDERICRGIGRIINEL